jgi:hypothetical protein
MHTLLLDNGTTMKAQTPVLLLLQLAYFSLPAFSAEPPPSASFEVAMNSDEEMALTANLR